MSFIQCNCPGVPPTACFTVQSSSVTICCLLIKNPTAKWDRTKNIHWMKSNRFEHFQVNCQHPKCVCEAEARAVHKEPNPAEDPAVQTLHWELSPSYRLLPHRLRHHSWRDPWKMLLWVEVFLLLVSYHIVLMYYKSFFNFSTIHF